MLIDSGAFIMIPLFYYLIWPFLLFRWYCMLSEFEEKTDEQIELTDGRTTATESFVPLSMELFCVPKTQFCLAYCLVPVARCCW